jgi:uncharacterized protein YggU (UPF0235/DUF167 family)
LARHCSVRADPRPDLRRHRRTIRETRLVREYAGALKLRLAAPPVDDHAKETLVWLLAERLNVPLVTVRILAGDKSRRKRVVIAGVRREQVLALLSAAKRPAKKAKD